MVPSIRFVHSDFADHSITYSCHMIIAALLSPAVKGLTSWLSFVVFNCVFVTFPYGILGQVLYLIVSIPDICHISFFFNQ